MQSEWRVIALDDDSWCVYRLFDRAAANHSGNREVILPYFNTQAEAEEAAKELNAKLVNVQQKPTLEIKALKIVLHKLQVAINSQNRTVKAEQEKLQSRAEWTEEEIQEMYGYGEITDEERYKLLDQLEGINAETPGKRALEILYQMYKETRVELQDLEFEALPEAERKRLLYERLNKMKQRGEISNE